MEVRFLGAAFAAVISLALSSNAFAVFCASTNNVGCSPCVQGSPAYDSAGPHCVSCGIQCTGTWWRQAAAAQEVSNQTEDRYLISVDEALVINVADINPDAAGMLAQLGKYSEALTFPIRAEGHAFATALHTKEMALAIHRGTYTSSDAADKVRPIAQTRKGVTLSSKIQWRIEKPAPGKATLILSQRTITEHNEIVAQNAPDVRVNLEWIEAGAGGYWQAVAASAIKQP